MLVMQGKAGSCAGGRLLHRCRLLIVRAHSLLWLRDFSGRRPHDARAILEATCGEVPRVDEG